MDVICVDGKYPADALAFFAHHGVVTPTVDSVYSIRDVIINSNSKTGLLLEELVNPKVPIQHPVMGKVVKMEPNWGIERFRHLDMTGISRESIREFIKESQGIKI